MQSYPQIIKSHPPIPSFVTNPNNRKQPVHNTPFPNGNIINHNKQAPLYISSQINQYHPQALYTQQVMPHFQYANNMNYGSTYQNRSFNRKNVRKQSKYNCYSCLDEPYQRVKNTGCNNSIVCPPNECIASDYKYSWFQ